MVKWVFDNDYIKRNYGEKLKDIWRMVITQPTPDLVIKVFYPTPRCWTEQMRYCIDTANGSINWMKSEAMYATMILHYPPDEIALVRHRDHSGARGLYHNGWQGRIISLFYGEGTSDYWIAFIMAHEYRHYRQFKRYGSAMSHYEDGRLHRPIQIEKDANRWSYRRIKELGFKNI